MVTMGLGRQKVSLGCSIYYLMLMVVTFKAQFLNVLSAVQSKLAHLESENGISRRRVRELERELDACKAEVQRERTRVMERESMILQQREPSHRSRRAEKIKANKSARFEDDEGLEQRYREVVEEKKGKSFDVCVHVCVLNHCDSAGSSHHNFAGTSRASYF